MDKKAMILEFMKEDLYRPMKFKELCSFFSVPKDQREEFKEMLDGMISSGDITLTAQNTYRIPRPDTLTGTFSSTARGFGFVTVPGRSSDIFVPADETKGAFHGDTVEVRIVVDEPDEGRPGKRRAEGRISRIIKRGSSEIIGTYQKSKYFGFVVPDDQKIGKDIFISKGKNAGAPDGSKVIVSIRDYGTSRRNPEGEIIQVLGMADDPRTDLISVLKTYGLEEAFPDPVMDEVRKISQSVSEDQLAGRRDLRSLMTVTIDGEDARDLDDAVTLSKENGIYRLGVHIADVSNYVAEGSELDKEALRRGTSTYLIDRVVPMLPRELSNGICSLNEGQDRLTLSCLMELDESGRVISHEICESVINVDHRMSYTQVGRLLEDKTAYEGRFDDALPMFYQMKELSDLIRARRRERGSIDFDFPEAKILLDENERPVDIHPYEINDANRIIEDFMLMANETVAQDYFWQELPFVYRCHEAPDPDRIHRLYMLIRNYGYYIHTRSDRLHPMEFQKLLGKIEGSPEETFISRLVLRSMQRARYTTENLGHFGLAVKYYCHFTSPIRRYPDLQIHRIIKENIHGKLDQVRQAHYRSILDEVCTQTSALERKADDAERDIEKLKKAEYMGQRIGEVYEGLISGITNWGIYVELENTCEGLIRLETMDDYYVYDEDECCLNGLDHGEVFRMGDRLVIRVRGVDPTTKTVLFEMIKRGHLTEEDREEIKEEKEFFSRKMPAGKSRKKKAKTSRIKKGKGGAGKNGRKRRG